MKKDLRLKFVQWLNNKVFKVPHGTYNKYVTFVYYCLYPMKYCYHKQTVIKYDYQQDTYHIEGIKFSGHIFRFFNDAKNENKRFQFTSNKEGIITVKELVEYNQTNEL